MRQLAVNPVWSFGASLAQPVFNGGLTGAQVEAARATYQSDVATYRQTVLAAIQQVDDQLSSICILSREASVQAEAVRAFRAGDSNRAQRIQRRHPEFHHRRHCRGSAADGRGGRVEHARPARRPPRSISLSRWAAACSQSRLPDALAQGAYIARFAMSALAAVGRVSDPQGADSDTPARRRHHGSDRRGGPVEISHRRATRRRHLCRRRQGRVGGVAQDFHSHRRPTTRLATSSTRSKPLTAPNRGPISTRSPATGE